MRKLSFWEFFVLLVKSFFSRVSGNIIVGGLSDFLRSRPRRGKGATRESFSESIFLKLLMGGGKASRTLNSERASPTDQFEGGGWKWSTECRSPQQQVNNLNYHPTICLTFMIPYSFLARSLSPEAPFYELPLFAPQERRAETLVEMEDENANLISKENEKIVRFDVFIFFVLFRPSSASSSLEVDCERLISCRSNWIFLGREVLGRGVHEGRDIRWKDRSNTIITTRNGLKGVFWFRKRSAFN